MIRSPHRLLGTAAILLAATLGLSFPATAADSVKVGFIYVGPIGDHGWSYRHDIGRQAIEKALGDKAKTSYVESVKEGPDAERVIQQLAADHDLIFTTSFGFMNPTVKVAGRNPKVKFEHATGYKRADNVSTYAARFYEGRYVTGKIAAKMTKSKIIGYVGAYPIPEVVRGINAYLLGARSVDPEITAKVIWVNSWYDPGKEADAAKALIDQGADIIAQHTDSPAPLQTAGSRGVYGFGQASDNHHFAPDAQLTAIIDNWDSYYVARAQAVLDGTWESADTWGGLKAGMVSMAPYTNMPDEVAALAKETEEGIKSGAIHPFAGPVKDQSGAIRVPEGEVLSDEELLKMDWYVEGVEGKVPQ
ncbi:MAG: BMP family ABC transporter substrate-binding protein [Magnetospiraceae bacterium]